MTVEDEDSRTRTTGKPECEKLPPPQDEDDGKWRTMDIMSKAKFVCGYFTIEPMLGCYIVTSVLAALCTQNLNLQKACRVNLRLGDEICSALENCDTSGNYTSQEIIVQELVADMMIWKTFVQSSIPSILIVFVGSWSDRNRKRKPCMIVPIVGELLTVIGLLICTYYFYELPMEVNALTESLPPAMTGGWMTMIMAVFSYIGDVSSIKYRTLRIGIANIFYSVAVPVGTALSGILFLKLGFYGVYTIAIVLYSFTIVYGVIFVKETNPKTSIEPPTGDTKSCTYFLKDFFSLSNVKEAIDVTFKKGQHNRRLRIVSLMVVVIVVMGPIYGEMSIMYMFTRVKFNWQEMDYSIFSTYSMVTNLLGTIFSVGLFSHKLEIDDALIGVMSCISKILAGIVYAFATTDFMFYMAPLVEIINGTSFIAMRSIISKLVPSDELGKVNSIFGVCEALVPLIYGPMYSAVYKATLKTFPGAFFLLGGALTAPAALIFLWMYNEHKKEKREIDELIRNMKKNPGEIEKENSLDIRLSSRTFEQDT